MAQANQNGKCLAGGRVLNRCLAKIAGKVLKVPPAKHKAASEPAVLNGAERRSGATIGLRMFKQKKGYSSYKSSLPMQLHHGATPI